MNGDIPTTPPPTTPPPPPAPPALKPPPNAVGRIRDSSGAITGYKLKDGSIWRGDTGAAPALTPPAGAVGRIKDSSGNVTGYKLKDGTIWRPPAAAAEAPSAPTPSWRDPADVLGYDKKPGEVSPVEAVQQAITNKSTEYLGPEVGPEVGRLVTSAGTGAAMGAAVGGPYGAIPGAVSGLVGQGAEDLTGYMLPNHPYIQKAVGFAAPFLLDVATPKFSGATKIGEEGVASSERAATKATTDATRAEAAAAAENAKRVAAAKGATEEQLQQYSTDVAERTQQAGKAQQAIEQQRANAEAEMPQKMAQLRAQAEKDLAKQAQSEAFGREVGAGRPPTDPEIIQREGQPPTTLPGQEEVARQAAFRNPMLDAINRSERELKLKRDAILAKRGTPAPTELQTPVAGETAKPPLEDPQAMLARLRGEGGPTRVVAGGGAPRPTNMPVTAPPPPSEPPIMTSKGVPYKSPGEVAGAPQPPAAPTSRVYKLTPEGRAVPVETPPAAPTTGPATARPLVEPDYPPEMQGQVHEFRQGLGDPKLRALITDEGLSRNTMKYIMDNQQVGIQLANGLDDVGKGQLRQGIADYYQNMGGSLDASHAPILKAAGFGKALSNPESWAYAERAQEHFATTIENAPAARQVLEQRMQGDFERLQAENDAGLVKEGLKWADKLPGGAGGRIRAAIEAAPTTDAKAQVVVDAFKHLEPEAPPIPPELGRGLAQGAPQGPELVTPRPTTDPAAAGQAAGIKRVQQVASRLPNIGFLGRSVQRRGIFAAAAAVLGGGAARGHPLPILGVGGVVGIKYLLTSAWRNAIINDPAEAERLFMAFKNPGISGNLTYISSRLTNQVVNQIGIMMGRQAATAPPPSDTKGTSASGPGPMSKAIEQKQAYQMASETRRVDPGHVDQVASLHRDVSTGKTPNVQHDLNNARLSQGEIRKMVEPAPPSAGQMFQGMQLADAMEAFGRGTDEEKAMALPLLAQKLNDEGKNLTPVQRRQMMAQLRQALPQEEGEAVG